MTIITPQDMPIFRNLVHESAMLSFASFIPLRLKYYSIYKKMKNNQRNLKEDFKGVLTLLGVVVIVCFVIYTIVKGFTDITYKDIAGAGFGIFLLFLLYTQTD